MHKKFHTLMNINEAYEKFKKNGVVFFDRLLDRIDFVESAKTFINYLNPGVITDKDLINLHLRDEWVANFVSKPIFTYVASSMLGVDSVKVYSSMLLSKEPKGMMTVPWHQDAAYNWPLNPIDCVSLWLALDNVSCENGAMKLAMGAHKNKAIKMEKTSELQEGDRFFSSQLESSIPQESLNEYQLIDANMSKGQSVLFHSMTPHSSPPNLSETRRAAFIIRYCRGDAKLNLYPGMKREEYFREHRLFTPSISKVA